MDIPLTDALVAKLGLNLVPGCTESQGNFGRLNLPKLEKSFWLDNGTISFDLGEGSFLIDPNNIEEVEVFTLLDLGFTIMHVMAYSEDSPLDDARSAYGLVGSTPDYIPSVVQKRLINTIAEADKPDARYIVTIHGLYGA